ncbi:hypothetical protein, partial [Streptomyces sp. NPDC005143]
RTSAPTSTARRRSTSPPAMSATTEHLDADVRMVGRAGIRIAWPEGDVQHGVLDRDTVTVPAEEGSPDH